MQRNPLNKVVFIQKVVAFTKKTGSPIKNLFRLAYVNNSWNDTIKNYSFHLFEKSVSDIDDIDLEKVCKNVIKNDVIWLMDVLTTSSKTLLNRLNLPKIVCKNRMPSLAMMKVVLKNIQQAGGKDMLQSQITSGGSWGNSCLMTAVTNTSSTEVLKLVFEKFVELGGNELLLSQLVAKEHYGGTCLMQGCTFSNSAEVMKLVFEKIVEAGGKDLLLSQVSAIGDDGRNCLMRGCRQSASLAVMKLVFEKIIVAGGKDLLKSQLTQTAKDGLTCLMVSCHNSSSEVVKLLAVVLVELGLFQEQYAKLGWNDKDRLKNKTEINHASWVPDRNSIAEVKKMLKC